MWAYLDGIELSQQGKRLFMAIRTSDFRQISAMDLGLLFYDYFVDFSYSLGFYFDPEDDVKKFLSKNPKEIKAFLEQKFFGTDEQIGFYTRQGLYLMPMAKLWDKESLTDGNIQSLIDALSVMLESESIIASPEEFFDNFDYDDLAYAAIIYLFGTDLCQDAALTYFSFNEPKIPSVEERLLAELKGPEALDITSKGTNSYMYDKFMGEPVGEIITPADFREFAERYAAGIAERSAVVFQGRCYLYKPPQGRHIRDPYRFRRDKDLARWLPRHCHEHFQLGGFAAYEPS